MMSDIAIYRQLTWNLHPKNRPMSTKAQTANCIGQLTSEVQLPCL
jgi:hypothetical protein